MKLFIFSLAVIFCSCSQAFYFETPNDVYRMKGTILFNDNTKLTGDITIPFEENYQAYINTGQFIQIIPEGKTTEERVSLNSITGYYIDSNFYALKRVFLFIDHNDHMLFVKRLTSEHSKIQLYILHQSGKSNPTGEETDDYFISLPKSGPYEAINTRSAKLIPDFDAKMSAFVADCPPIADKIRSRADGYFLPFVTIDRFKHRDVLMKIINEYNNCQ